MYQTNVSLTNLNNAKRIELIFNAFVTSRTRLSKFEPLQLEQLIRCLEKIEEEVNSYYPNSQLGGGK